MAGVSLNRKIEIAIALVRQLGMDDEFVLRHCGGLPVERRWSAEIVNPRSDVVALGEISSDFSAEGSTMDVAVDRLLVLLEAEMRNPIGSRHWNALHEAVDTISG